MHRRRQRRLDLRLRDREVAGRDLGVIDVDRQPGRRALQAREGTDDRGRGGLAVELPPGAARHDLGRPSVQHDRRLPGRHVHRSRDLVQLVAEGGVVHLRRRRDIGTEETHVEPPEAAQRAESFPLPAHRVDRRTPVDPDTKAARLEAPRARADPKGDRHRGELTGAAGQDRAPDGQSCPPHRRPRCEHRSPVARATLRRRARERSPREPRSQRRCRSVGGSRGAAPAFAGGAWAWTSSGPEWMNAARPRRRSLARPLAGSFRRRPVRR